MAKQRNYSINDIDAWKFKKVGMPEEWVSHLGHITENFRMLIEGKSGHGKTEYMMKLTKMLAMHYGKVNVNSTEQGRSASLQDAFKRNNMSEIKGGKWMLCDHTQRTFEPWFERLQRPNSGRVIVLDSLDYMNLTFKQFKMMHEKFKHKSIIIVCWNDPMDAQAKKIKYNCDIKVEVVDYMAQIRSRFGGNKPFEIWPERFQMTSPQLALTETITAE